uniref:SEC7 domain-containing protein n=1 Tax=Bubo bubo TaxID=30461 RepID=A0A8C0EKY9_BUBBB
MKRDGIRVGTWLWSPIKGLRSNRRGNIIKPTELSYFTYLIEHQVLSSDLQEIAKFLHKGEGLNKTAIGDYLGGRDPTNIQILQAFVACHQFANLNLVQALRQFLWSFRLPGEAQKIDRMMEAFANWYCKCNPGVFQSTDTCYILSFSIIMLNTSLHNPNVKDKPPFERFVSINRGIDKGGDLPEELLKVRRHPIF